MIAAGPLINITMLSPFDRLFSPTQSNTIKEFNTEKNAEMSKQ